MKKLKLFLVAVILSGCQSGGQIWGATENIDQFTDKITKMVTVGEGLSHNTIFTQSLKYYPFIGIRDGEIYVGIRSGGRYRIPTGTVQIRIDNNTAWTISPEETPIYLAPTLPAPPQVTASPSANQIVAQAQTQAMENAAKIMSPFTATTGQRARAIIKEMAAGKTIKYRTVGINQAASTTGEVPIDASFSKSLREIGINPENL